MCLPPCVLQVRMLSLLQPALINLAPSGLLDEEADADMRLARLKAFDRTRAYYQVGGGHGSVVLW